MAHRAATSREAGAEAGVRTWIYRGTQTFVRWINQLDHGATDFFDLLEQKGRIPAEAYWPSEDVLEAHHKKAA